MTTDQPRRVVVMIDSLTPGGAERIAVEAAGGLAPDRYRARLLVTRSTGALEGLAGVRGVAVTVLDRRHGFAPRKLVRALRIVRSSDVLHAHLWGSAMWGVLLARLTRTPFVAHVHRFDGDVSRWWTPGYRYWIAPAAAGLVCVSTDLARELERVGIPAAKLRVVENAVSTGDALPRDEARRELGIAHDGTVVGMIARLRVEKRHDLALRALALLREADIDATLCVIGDGPESERLAKLGDELGLSSAVIWTGALENAGRLVRAFDVALVTSDSEGMPLAGLEALVAGVPIVSTPAGAMPDLLAMGGGLLTTGEPSAIAATLRTALNRTVSGESDLARSIEWATTRFSIARMARELEAIYDEAVDRR